MEDDMFRRIEHKPRKKASDEKSIDGEPSHQPPIEEEHHSVIFETHTDDPSPSEIRMEVSVPSEDREPARDMTRSEQTPPEKRTAVEVIFGPNNRKKRKEAQKLAVSEGMIQNSDIDGRDEQRGSAVDTIFGPNNRKKREEAQARARAQGLKVDELGNPVYPEHKKTAVEALLGPNNKKYRKEAQERARAEGKTVDEYGQPVEPRKTAVEVIFGPNNRKKRKEAARMERQVDTVEPEGPEEQHDDGKRLEL